MCVRYGGKGRFIMNKVILVASGKGGVGKTTLSANIAGYLERMGKRVLLIDADLQLRNLDLVLGVQDSALFDIQDLYRGNCAEDKAETAVAGHGDLMFVAAPMRLQEPAEAVYKYIGRYAANRSYVYDFVFIDCPAGISDGVMSLARPGVSVLCVATPDRTSVRDAERLSMELRSNGVKDVRLVINRIDPSLVKKGRAPDMDDIVDGTGVRLIGLVPEDSCVSACANRGRLVCDDSRLKIGRAYRNIALRISGAQAPLYKFW